MGHGAYHVFFHENRRESPEGGREIPRTGREDEDGVLRPFEDWFNGLSDSDQICWAYGITPSQYDDLAATEIWYDVTYKLRVRLGEVTVNHLQQHYSMVKILSQAFGGKDESKTVKVNEMTSAKEAVTSLNDFFGGKS